MPDVVFPPAFESRMRAELGDAWPSFAEAHQIPSATAIRVHPHKRYSPPAADIVPWAQKGRYLPARPVFTLDPSFHGGAYYVQEASSMFLEQALHQSTNLDAPLAVLDLCAAPGGKSTHLLSLLSPDSLLVSNEVIRTRAAILSENIQKWGYTQALVTNSDPEQFSTLHGLFDVIVVDAPCSGEGLFRKDAGAMQEWSPDNVALCASRQKRILAQVWPALKPGGILIYCTCTYNAQENEDNLQWLAQERDAAFLKLDVPAAWGIETITQGDITGYRFYPHRVKGEGFFLSVIRKQEDEKEVRLKASKKMITPVSRKIGDQVMTWLGEARDTRTLVQFHDRVLILPSRWQSTIEALSERLHVMHAGVSAATVKHEKLIPEHTLALALDLNPEAFQQVELTLQDALRYLRKEAVFFEGMKKGFTLMTYAGVPLGWINALENRANNLYPAEWRIRMQ
jgi:16S rRNA C967 or C1407 C5-methylase (RsmB/RsmF family)/NOL1/NOP2/fmu family ribosome biogenesis protein